MEKLCTTHNTSECHLEFILNPDPTTNRPAPDAFAALAIPSFLHGLILNPHNLSKNDALNRQ
jgi:hypothetical protein